MTNSTFSSVKESITVLGAILSIPVIATSFPFEPIIQKEKSSGVASEAEWHTTKSWSWSKLQIASYSMGFKSDFTFTEIHWPMSQITLRRNGLYLGGEKSWNCNVQYLKKSISLINFII